MTNPRTLARRNWLDSGWEAAEPGMAAVTAVVSAGAQLRARVDAILAPFGLTFPRYEVLSLLRFARSRALPLAKVAERLQIQPASLTHTVRKLVEDGHVARTANPRDRRGGLISITDQGLALVAAATPELNRFFASREVTAPDALLAQLDHLTKE